MKAIFFIWAYCFFLQSLLAQKESFDLTSYTSPKQWKKEIKSDFVSYTIIDNKKNAWCRISVIKSTVSKGSIDLDFSSEWQDLVVVPYKTTDAPETDPVQDKDGWKMKTGVSKFVFNNSNSMALLTTISGYTRCVSIVAITNSQAFLKDIQAFLSSVNLKKPEGIVSGQQPAGTKGANLSPNNPTTGNPISVTPPAAGFAFTTTTYNDGWVATAEADWVSVIKGSNKVLIHYPNKAADIYNSVLLEGLKNAWNVLVAPRYSSASNMVFKPTGGWEAIEFAEADMVEKTTGKTVHVVLFKRDYQNGNGKYVEFISPDKQSFEKEFGVYRASMAGSGFEKMENMAFLNKFAVAATDLGGKWTSDFSGAIQYVNAYTGFDAGMDTHASSEHFEFSSGNSYKWDLAVASGPVGNIKFQSVKASGKFTMNGNWKITLSDIEGKPRSYDVYFSCIKGLRILWMNNKPFAKAD
jgi:hypothetical protein